MRWLDKIINAAATAALVLFIGLMGIFAALTFIYG